MLEVHLTRMFRCITEGTCFTVSHVSNSCNMSSETKRCLRSLGNSVQASGVSEIRAVARSLAWNKFSLRSMLETLMAKGWQHCAGERCDSAAHDQASGDLLEVWFFGDFQCLQFL